ncbi:hypothetical protein EYF80_024707 [Liparis tanakae]|uniref:Uncharacterized protein n=1 Tax=Liparis tanakae TaxID=230148 RepID=A0A4Z2HGV5_9TELE|nr:hypothetical protein EYF80_024707 [Liparis tanakae]
MGPVVPDAWWDGAPTGAQGVGAESPPHTCRPPTSHSVYSANRPRPQDDNLLPALQSFKRLVWFLGPRG